MAVGFGEKVKEENGWILVNNNQLESLIVSFETPVFVSEICIYESVNPGCIAKLEIFESQRSKIYEKFIVMTDNERSNFQVK